jgi:hypothetical protein
MPGALAGRPQPPSWPRRGSRRRRGCARFPSACRRDDRAIDQVQDHVYDPGRFATDLINERLLLPSRTHRGLAVWATRHFDQPIHVTGTIVLDGVEIPVYCYSVRIAPGGRVRRVQLLPTRSCPQAGCPPRPAVPGRVPRTRSATFSPTGRTWSSTRRGPGIASGSSSSVMGGSGGAGRTGRCSIGPGSLRSVPTIWPRRDLQPLSGNVVGEGGGRRPDRRRPGPLVRAGGRRSPTRWPAWPPTEVSRTLGVSAWPPRCATGARSGRRGRSWLSPG